MKYLLIPIEDLDKIDLELALAEDGAHGEEGMIITKLRGRKYKQISLDEKDIDDKAAQYVEQHLHMYNERYKQAGFKDYKQALKDLL